MKKALVTGCAGFIGSHVAEALLDLGFEVWGIDNFDPYYPKPYKLRNLEKALATPRFHFIEADLCLKEYWKQLPSSLDLVVHLAAKAGVRPSIEDPEAYLNTNITATQSLLEGMVKRNIKKLVMASSSSVYGNNPNVPFAEEQAVDHPISPYAMSKKACELLTYTYHHLYGIQTVNLRFFTVYGPRQRPDLAITKFIRLIDKDFPIPVYGDGSSARDYTYISDIVEGILAAAHLVEKPDPIYEVIKLGNSAPIALSELIQRIYALMHKTPNIERLPKQAGDVERTYASVEKAERVLGYAPKVQLEEGLKACIEYVRGHGE
jgi:UDP-glucuronate 4-epimerase